MEHPEEWEGIKAERIAATRGATRSQQIQREKNPKAAAHPEEWEGIRAAADASDGWEASTSGRDVTELFGSEMAAEATSGREAVSSRTIGNDTDHTMGWEPPKGMSSMKSMRQDESSISGSSGGGSSGGSGGNITSSSRSFNTVKKESTASSTSPDYASPISAHHSQDLGRATIPMDSSTGLGQQPPITTAGGFSTADIREGSIPNLAVGAASIPSFFTLETQPRPAPTAVTSVPFSTTTTSSSTSSSIKSSRTSTFTGSSSTSMPSPSTSSTSHSSSPNITASSGLSGRFAEQQKPKKKTQAQMDEELRMRMDDMAGEGGAAGVEYEDGKPVAMKRGVRDNMFRYI